MSYDVNYNLIFTLQNQLKEENILRLLTSVNLYMRESLLFNDKILKLLTTLINSSTDFRNSNDYTTILNLINTINSHISLLKSMRNELKELVAVKALSLSSEYDLSHDYKSKVFWHKNFDFDTSNLDLKSVIEVLLNSYKNCINNVFELYPIIYANNIPSLSAKIICLKGFCRTLKTIIDSVNIATSSLSKKTLDTLF